MVTALREVYITDGTDDGENAAALELELVWRLLDPASADGIDSLFSRGGTQPAVSGHILTLDDLVRAVQAEPLIEDLRQSPADRLSWSVSYTPLAS